MYKNRKDVGIDTSVEKFDVFILYNRISYIRTFAVKALIAQQDRADPS